MSETVILCVDRDNDIGEKTDNKGPIIGEKENKRVANELLLADPEESDANTIFQGLRLKQERQNTEIVTITGDKQVGVKSDEKLEKQLEEIKNNLEIKKAILVSDGAEDEYILPIVQSKMEIVSVKRVIVKQSEQLEGAYYMIKRFLHDVAEDPRMAKIFLGIPAIVLVILSIFGTAGWRVVLGALGLYLIIKGFKLEGVIESVITEFSTSLQKGRITFFMYVLATLFSVLGLYYGYTSMTNIGTFDLLTSSFAFLNGSVYIFFIAGFFVWIGRLIMAYTKREHSLRYLTVLSLLFAIIIVTKSATNLILKPDVGFTTLATSIIIGFLALGISLSLERIKGR